MKQFWCGLLWMGLLWSHAQAQTTLQGSLYDRISGQPLRNVSVIIEGSTLGDVTDKAGHFSISNLKPGIYHLRASQSGYVSNRREVAIKPNQPLLSLGIALQSSVAKLHPDVMITAQRYERDPFYSPASVSFYDRQQFKQESPRTLADALQGLPGMWLQQSYYGGQTLNIRGAGDQRNVLMIDGIRLRHAAYGPSSHSLLGSIDPFSMDRVEVLRGGGSVQYETDAIGGVLQLFSRSPRFAESGVQVHGSLQGRGMSQGMEASGRGELELSTERIAVSAGGTFRSFGDQFAARSLGRLAGTAYQERSADLKARIKLSSQHELTLAYQEMQQDSLLQWSKVRFANYEQAGFTDLKRQLAYARLTSYFPSRWFSELRFTTAYQNLQEGRIHQEKQTTDPLTESEQVGTWSGTLEVHSRPQPFWHAVSGLEYHQDAVGNRATRQGQPTPASYPTGSSATNLGLYSQHTFDILDLRISLGARARAVRLNVPDQELPLGTIRPNVLVGNISGLYPLHPNWHLVSSFNTGTRTPNLYDVSRIGYLDQGFGVPSDSLSAERSRTTELGLKAKTSHFSGSLTLYHTHFQDRIDWVPTTFQGSDTYEGQAIFQQANTGMAFVRGIEAAIEVPVNQLFALYGGVTYTQGQNITQNEPLSQMPPLNGRLGLRFRSRAGLWSNLEWRQASGQDRLGSFDRAHPYVPAGGSEGWKVLDLHLGYDFAWGYATIGIKNLLDEAYHFHASSLDASGRVILMSVQLGF